MINQYSHFTLHVALSEAQRPQASTSACSAAGLRSAFARNHWGRGSALPRPWGGEGGSVSQPSQTGDTSASTPLESTDKLAFNFHPLSPTFHHLSDRSSAGGPNPLRRGFGEKSGWLCLASWPCSGQCRPGQWWVHGRLEQEIAICPSVHLYNCPIYLYIIFGYLRIYLSSYLLIYLFGYLSVYLS
jgi:hypothetical protein